jgi:hypothetical protein
MDREQLEALRRQVEEDYKLDIAAIERLLRRYPAASSHIPSSNVPYTASSTPRGWTEVDSRLEPPSPVPPPTGPSERKSDELEGSLRTMFSVGRK